MGRLGKPVLMSVCRIEQQVGGWWRNQQQVGLPKISNRLFHDSPKLIHQRIGSEKSAIVVENRRQSIRQKIGFLQHRVKAGFTGTGCSSQTDL